jgi:DNA-binding CsgD family transcriptional regulator
VAHIDSPGAYFMQTAKNLWRDHLRRASVIRFEDYTENPRSFVMPEAMGVENEVAARQQLLLVERLLASLPERCRRIFTLKRVEGLSQREIARSLGVSESVVENDVQKALRLLQAAMRSAEAGEAEPPVRAKTGMALVKDGQDCASTVDEAAAHWAARLDGAQDASPTTGPRLSMAGAGPAPRGRAAARAGAAASAGHRRGGGGAGRACAPVAPVVGGRGGLGGGQPCPRAAAGGLARRPMPPTPAKPAAWPWPMDRR